MTKQYVQSEKERKQKAAEMRRYRERVRQRGGKTGGTNDGYANRVARLYVDKFLSEHPCVDCGYSDIRALEFDHVRGTKSFEISRAIQDGASLPLLMEEIEKCEVRCANCHRIRHKK